ncbi:hypothetical protein JYU34_020554 [Plutella xylostella]|uniref:Uncharacterized protein n=1 Tax=Plutella xylostella TaxID=51655 RepID=A0ABQ7PW82_PLUXY|nr:hypothetical protein JYU34_020554 [Plutella xylostella]
MRTISSSKRNTLEPAIHRTAYASPPAYAIGRGVTARSQPLARNPRNEPIKACSTATGTHSSPISHRCDRVSAIVQSYS